MLVAKKGTQKKLEKYEQIAPMFQNPVVEADIKPGIPKGRILLGFQPLR